MRINGLDAVKGTLLQAGDVIDVEGFRHPDEGPLANPDLDLCVLEDQGGLLAIDKPAGRATQPLDFEETDTVLNAVLGRFPEVAGIGEGGLMSAPDASLTTAGIFSGETMVSSSLGSAAVSVVHPRRSSSSE